MTTIMLIPDKAYKLARPKIKDHHLTVAYFGKGLEDDSMGRLRRLVDNIAYQTKGPIPAKANGIGMFDAGEDGVAVVDLIDGIGTLKVRMSVELAFGDSRIGYTLDPAKINYAHGFTPHMTREYLDREDDFYAEICVDMVPSIEFNFVAIGLWGDKTPDGTEPRYEVDL